jgi:enoyl-[acyl-carrier protein] reductase II
MDYNFPEKEASMANELTRRLGIKYPIIQGGMVQIAGARLVAAVSNAGGLGTLGGRPDLESWHEEIKKTRALTERPFAVNLAMHASELDRRVRIIVDEGVRIVVTAAGDPTRVLGPLKEAGCTVMHVVAAVKQARKVAAAGVDAVIAEGGESGGMVAKDRVATVVFVPMVVDAVSVPVVAAGGIADARGLAAALALGAQAVQLGTAFIVAAECEAGDDWKQAVIAATETDTEIVPRGAAQGRVLKQAGLMAGQVSGMITRAESAQEIIERIMKDAGPALERALEMLA